MKIRHEDWKRGVLFTCLLMHKQNLDNDCNTITIDILKNAQIEKKELFPILECYEDPEDIIFLKNLMVEYKI